MSQSQAARPATCDKRHVTLQNQPPISGVSFHKWGIPKNGWFISGKIHENPTQKMDENWYPHDFGNLQMWRAAHKTTNRPRVVREAIRIFWGVAEGASLNLKLSLQWAPSVPSYQWENNIHVDLCEIWIIYKSIPRIANHSGCHPSSRWLRWLISEIRLPKIYLWHGLHGNQPASICGVYTILGNFWWSIASKKKLFLLKINHVFSENCQNCVSCLNMRKKNMSYLWGSHRHCFGLSVYHHPGDGIQKYHS